MEAPNKIYLTAETYQALTDGSKFVGAYAEKMHDKEVGFILESEHERIVSELKKDNKDLKIMLSLIATCSIEELWDKQQDSKKLLKSIK